MRKTFFKRMAAMIAAAVTATAALAANPVGTWAANGDGGMYFYDFDGYTGAVGSGSGPDENWGCFGGKSFGAYNSDDEHGTVMKMKAGSEPSFLFGEKVNSGRVQLSFDAKMTNENIRTMIFFYDGRQDEITNMDYYSKPLYLNCYAPNTLQYYTPPTSWTYKLADVEYNSTEWHHFDIISTELSESTASVNVYMDGQQLNMEPLNIASSKGLHTWSFKCAGITGTTTGAEDGMLLDNVLVRRFAKDSGFIASITDGSRFPVENGRISVVTSERLKTPPTAENIVIRNTVTGKTVTNFRVENYTGQSFDIVFNGKVDYGRHNISFKNTRGEISDENLSSVLVADTEYKSELSEKTHLSLDFNDYQSTDGSLPSGFECLESGVELYAKSAPGKSGETGDFAMGFSGMPGERATKRVMYRFDEPVPQNTELELQFDIYGENATQYFYLAEQGDFSTENPDYKNNSLISVNQNGQVRYASGRSAAPDTLLDSSLALESGQWHNFKIKIHTDLKTGTNRLVIAIDGGDEYTVPVSRRFTETAIYGFGVGYAKTLSADGEVRFDNIQFVKRQMVYYPEVDEMAVFDGLGNKVDLNGRETSMISRVEAYFNEIISTELDEFITVTEDGNPYPFRYEVTDNMNIGRSTLTIYFDGLLNPLCEYKVSIKRGVPSRTFSSVTSFIDYSTTIKSIKDTSFKCVDNGYNAETGEASVTFSKNNGMSGTFLYSVAAYKNVTGTDGKVTRKLTDIRYMIIDITAQDTGVMTYTLTLDGASDADEIETYIWRYPKLERLEQASDGTIL